MFTPSQMEQIPVEVERQFRQLETRVMRDIIRRITINLEITRSADYQIYRMSELGAGSEEIKKALEQALKKSNLDVDKLYADIIETGYANDNKLYNSVGVEQIPFKDNKELQQLISAMKEQTNSTMKNITASLGFVEIRNGKRFFRPITKFYEQTLDNAILDITTGLFDYNTVIKRTVETMTNSGLRSVDYDSGYSSRVDVAARRAIMTGVNQVTGHIAERNAEILGTEYFEVSWHGTARPSHQEWQGKVYTKEELESVCGLGTASGLLGVNCRHTYWPFVDGISERMYTDEQLEGLNAVENKPTTYFGKEYTSYEAIQHQRQLETRMRAQRQQIKLYKDAKCDDLLMLTKAKYRVTMSEYADFSKTMNLPQQVERIYQDGLGRSA